MTSLFCFRVCNIRDINAKFSAVMRCEACYCITFNAIVSVDYDQMRCTGFYSLLWVQFAIQHYCVDNIMDACLTSESDKCTGCGYLLIIINC